MRNENRNKMKKKSLTGGEWEEARPRPIGNSLTSRRTRHKDTRHEARRHEDTRIQERHLVDAHGAYLWFSAKYFWLRKPYGQ